MIPEFIETFITNLLDTRFPESLPFQFQSVGGGSINDTYRVFNNQHIFFCKINSATKFPQMFVAEMRGLEKLKATGARTPEILFCKERSDYQVLLMEWVEEGRRTPAFWRQFGEALARLHHTHSDSFGFDHDNYMGSVPQSNQHHTDWCAFFQHQRLEPLVQICLNKQLLVPDDLHSFERLYEKLVTIFESRSKPSLLHGDLWSGNFMCNASEEVVLIDPATYFGHPAVDIGMTRLFGGFASNFYEAYEYYADLPDDEQCQVANLYPLLIHLYLFGTSYRTQIRQILSRYQ